MALSKKDCVSALAKAGMDEKEAQQTVEDMLQQKAKLAADGKLARTSDLVDAMQANYDALRMDNAVKRKQAALAILRRSELDDFIRTTKAKGGTFHDAIMTKMVGNPKRIFGARQSIDANRAAIFNTFNNQFEQGIRQIAKKNNLSKKALLKIIGKDPEFRAKFVQERMEPGSVKDPMIREFAELYERLSEEMRIRLNRAGANIGKLEGRLPQRHNEMKMLDASIGTKDDWISFVSERIDTERSFSGLSPEEVRGVLDNVYDTIVLGRGRVAGNTDVPAVQTPRNIASGLDKHRVLHFRDAKAYLEYSDKYGSRNLWESIVGEMDSAARTLSLMETLGPNPEHMIRSLIQSEIDEVRLAVERKEITAQDGKKRMDELEGMYTGGGYAMGDVAKWLAVLTGETMRPANVGAAKAWGMVRTVQSMAKLGGATLSAVADLFTKAMSLRTNGANLLEAHGRAIGDVIRTYSPEDMRVLNDLGFYFDLENSAMLHRFDMADTIPGKMHSLMNTFFRMTGLTQWTERQKAGMAQWLSNALGDSRKLDFDGLHADVRAMLEYHGVDSARWDIYRKYMVEEFEGKRYMNPSMARNLTDAQIAHLLPEHLQGKVRKGYSPETWAAARQLELDRLRTRIETDARAFFVDETKFAVIEPDARTTATMTQGTRPGTKPGEALRLIMQFKSFPIAFWQRTVGGRRWVRGELQEGMHYGFNYDSIKDAFTRDTLGMVNYMTSALAYGYVAMTLKDLAKNRTPKDPTKPETWAAAAMQSGGAGIYGDFFLGKANRFGNDFLETLAGPTLGELSSIVNALNGIAHGDVEKGRDTLIRVGIGNTPFGNLWYTKAATDWLFLDNLKEWMSPGYKRRLRKNMEKEYGQRQLVR
ncbi:hypothetical protein LJC46_04225 [Desulfovibrio sp. OttesenSCG-928-G15]|nr:hypothetical protein [Desulfovibrio sp. OttesenSCG-928-G15]